MTTTDAPEAPGADTSPSPKNKSARAKRYWFYPDGLDYVLLSVERGDDGQPKPNGALSAVPEVPRFESAQEAKRWVQGSGTRLAGMTVLIVRMMTKLQIVVENKPLVTVNEEKRFQKQLDEKDAETEDGPE